MTEDNAAGTKPEEPLGGAEPKKLDLTQKDLDELIGKVRTETRTQSEKEIAKLRSEYEEKAKLAALKEEERAKAEKEMEIKKLNDELAESKRALRLKAAEAELAKTELDPSFAPMVLGEDDETTAGNIAALKKQVEALVKKQVDGSLKTGAPPKGGTAANENTN
ncbi:MAG: DUF4355 domain-containing protein [Methanomassiliicoccaceae archaeon]|nr:DUF4355 domain-containing protein [Methanomassiliicoccaceae archaeon]